MEITSTTIYSKKISNNIKIAVASDLHNREADNIIAALKKTKPDIIAIPGDLCEKLNCPYAPDKNENALKFLSEASKIAKVFYSLGNHEKKVSVKSRDKIRRTGAILLEDNDIKEGELLISGLSSGLNENHLGETPAPNLVYLKQFAAKEGFKILLSHHPEYYDSYIKQTNIDLIISGHAHGGQIRIFNKGIYSPGQGFFPKYTSGLYDNRLFVSRGLTNTFPLIPRIFNKPELAIIELKAKKM